MPPRSLEHVNSKLKGMLPYIVKGSLLGTLRQMKPPQNFDVNKASSELWGK